MFTKILLIHIHSLQNGALPLHKLFNSGFKCFSYSVWTAFRSNSRWQYTSTTSRGEAVKSETICSPSGVLLQGNTTKTSPRPTMPPVSTMYSPGLSLDCRTLDRAQTSWWRHPGAPAVWPPRVHRWQCGGLSCPAESGHPVQIQRICRDLHRITSETQEWSSEGTHKVSYRTTSLAYPDCHFVPGGEAGTKWRLAMWDYTTTLVFSKWLLLYMLCLDHMTSLMKCNLATHATMFTQHLHVHIHPCRTYMRAASEGLWQFQACSPPQSWYHCLCLQLWQWGRASCSGRRRHCSLGWRSTEPWCWKVGDFQGDKFRKQKNLATRALAGQEMAKDWDTALSSLLKRLSVI